MKQTELPSFKQAYCAHFQCDPEDYIKHALYSSFYPHAVPVALILYALKSPSIRLTLTTLEQLGKAEDLEHVVQIMEGYRYQVSLHGPKWMTSFRIRISGRRVLNHFSILAKEMAQLSPVESSKASTDNPAAALSN